MFEAKFQTFDDPAEPTASAPRVAALRTELARRGLILKERIPLEGWMTLVLERRHKTRRNKARRGVAARRSAQ